MKKTEKGLSAWQLTMMALGTVIGGSFFLGSAVAIQAAGPAVILSFILGGVLVYYILNALSEMTVDNPDAGSFRAFAAQAFGPGAGFVVGWIYWTGMVLAMSSEAAAVSILLRTWYPRAGIGALGSAIIGLVTLLNLLGARRLSSLESGLAAVKVAALAAFILTALVFVAGWFPGGAALGAGALENEPFFPGGAAGIAGSMLIVMFSYSGFEVIGLAASEARDPKRTVPRAIRATVVSLVLLYILTIAVLLPLIPTAALNTETSPLVSALDRQGLSWAGDAINFVLITAVLSTMLATMFGLGRVIRSLAADRFAPRWLREKTAVPYRGILLSGVAMLAGLWFGMLLPQVYLFLVSAGGFATLFTYAAIMAAHIRLRTVRGGTERRKFPVSSVLVLLALIAAMVSMPYVSGQKFGLIAGVLLVVLFTAVYGVLKWTREARRKTILREAYWEWYSTEFAMELHPQKDKPPRD